jgi:glycosyltransferase involved in cell wall biosynthesis
MGQADLSIVLSQYNRPIAEKLWPRRIAVVANGIPDPFPQFEQAALPRRIARLAARKKLAAGHQLTEREQAQAGADPSVIRVFFLAHCTREKGLFDAVQATLLANEKLRAQNSPLSLRLIVAGTFPDPNEKREFDRLCPGASLQAGAQDRASASERQHADASFEPSAPQSGPSAIQYAGFLQGPQKSQAMLQADLLCFPSHWESFGVVLVEAMAFGLPMVTTRCTSVPDVVPPNYRGLADVGDPAQIAAALLDIAFYEDFTGLRQHFLSHFTVATFSSNLAAALHSIDAPPTGLTTSS